MSFVLLFWTILAVGNCQFPLDFHDSDFYLPPRKGGIPSVMIEDIRRGQEGVLIKLQQVTDELENDELKLNNIFYKLGHHETQLKSVTSGIGQLTALGRKTESKLNKHSFNVEFLHQQVQDLKRKLNNQADAQDRILNLQKMVIHLEQRLSYNQLNLSPQHRTDRKQNGSVGHLLMAPITYVRYPASDHEACEQDWKLYEGSCYFISKDRRTFKLAVAFCAQMKGSLISLTDQNVLALQNIFKNSDDFWSSATDMFSRQLWTFLMSGRLVRRQFWANHRSVHHLSSIGNHCASWTSKGLVPVNCGHRKLFVCQKIGN